MRLQAGQKVGPYEILAPLGAGGMGEVYRARDTRLSREVAFKVLHERLSSDPERLKRFEKEARSASALNHPSIVTIYEVGQSDGLPWIAMERVEGETLRELLQTGPLSIKRLLQIAAPVAQGLAKAHEAGIVHRDLKPENLMINRDGLVKILDFGLAKLTSTGSGSEEVSQLPTTEATTPGVLVGTVGYMSPEQASGAAVGFQSDQFALGAILYEMATGRRAFQKKTAVDTLSAILNEEPEALLSLDPKAPASFRWIVERCLAKEPKDRYASTEDLASDLVRLRDHLGEVSGSGGVAAIPRRRSRISPPFVAGAAALLAAILTAVYLRRAPEPHSPIRSSLTLPERMKLAQMALSPDGIHLAFTARDAETSMPDNEGGLLWIRSLDEATAHAVTVPGDASFPFWSPDSRFVAFFSDGKLRRVDVAGGIVQTICDAEFGRGGTWGQDGTIVFSPAGLGPLYRVAASGGEPAAVTRLDASRGETSHRYPFFLPDGRHFLYMASIPQLPLEAPPNAIRVASLDGKLDKVLVPAGSSATYASGRLFYVRERTLFARPFDLVRLEASGVPVPIAKNIGGNDGGFAAFPFSVTERLLVYLAVPPQLSTLVWIDRSGKAVGTLGEPDLFLLSPRLSPDGRKVAIDLEDSTRFEAWDIRIYDVATSAHARLGAVAGSRLNFSPVWSPQGDRVLFYSDRRVREGKFTLLVKPINAKGEEVLLEDSDYIEPEDWSPDGHFVSFTRRPRGKREQEIWVLTLAGERKAAPFATEAPNQGESRFSPDGRWIAFVSNESDRAEVYVRPFPGPGGESRVSVAGGDFPRWRRDGKELFYLSADNKLMAVPVTLNPTFQAGVPEALFSVRPSRYDVSPDGQRFLVRSRSNDEASASTPLTLLADWKALLSKD
jgi:serine/threonine protein kinase/Tol biopolymer transport system component